MSFSRAVQLECGINYWKWFLMPKLPGMVIESACRQGTPMVRHKWKNFELFIIWLKTKPSKIECVVPFHSQHDCYRTFEMLRTFRTADETHHANAIHNSTQASTQNPPELERSLLLNNFSWRYFGASQKHGVHYGKLIRVTSSPVHWLIMNFILSGQFTLMLFDNYVYIKINVPCD